MYKKLVFLNLVNMIIQDYANEFFLCTVVLQLIENLYTGMFLFRHLTLLNSCSVLDDYD